MLLEMLNKNIKKNIRDKKNIQNYNNNNNNHSSTREITNDVINNNNINNINKLLNYNSSRENNSLIIRLTHNNNNDLILNESELNNINNKLTINNYHQRNFSENNKIKQTKNKIKKINNNKKHQKNKNLSLIKKYNLINNYQNQLDKTKRLLSPIYNNKNIKNDYFLSDLINNNNNNFPLSSNNSLKKINDSHKNNKNKTKSFLTQKFIKIKPIELKSFKVNKKYQINENLNSHLKELEKINFNVQKIKNDNHINDQIKISPKSKKFKSATFSPKIEKLKNDSKNAKIKYIKLLNSKGTGSVARIDERFIKELEKEKKLNNNKIDKNYKKINLTPFPQIDIISLNENKEKYDKMASTIKILRRLEYTIGLKHTNMIKLYDKSIKLIQKKWKFYFYNIRIPKIIKIQKNFRTFIIRKKIINYIKYIKQFVWKIKDLNKNKNFDFFISKLKKYLYFLLKKEQKDNIKNYKLISQNNFIIINNKKSLKLGNFMDLFNKVIPIKTFPRHVSEIYFSNNNNLNMKKEEIKYNIDNIFIKNNVYPPNKISINNFNFVDKYYMNEYNEKINENKINLVKKKVLNDKWCFIYKNNYKAYKIIKFLQIKIKKFINKQLKKNVKNNKKQIAINLFLMIVCNIIVKNIKKFSLIFFKHNFYNNYIIPSEINSFDEKIMKENFQKIK